MVDLTVWDEADPLRQDANEASTPVRGSDPTTEQPVGFRAISRLINTIENEIIPRLLLASRPPLPRAAGPELSILAENVAEFAKLTAAHDVAVANAYIHALLDRGFSLETIYLDLLAPAARLLGDWWKADIRDFTEVSVGLCRMRQVLHEFSDAFIGRATTFPEKSILLMPLPGEQHSLGLAMVAEFFRRAGWDVWNDHPATEEDLLCLLGKQWFAIIGVSVSCESKIGQLSRLITVIRANSRNPVAGVFVGGQPFIGHPERVLEVGADGTAVDGRQAVSEASRLFQRKHPK